MDARQLLSVFPKRECIDTIITSPPYWQLKDYGRKAQIGFGQTKLQYLADIEKVLRDCWQVTKPTGSLWLVADDYRQGGVLHLLPWQISQSAERAGWIMRELIVWDKGHAAPWHMKGQMRNVTEFIVLMSKGDTYKFNVDRIKIVDELSKWWVDFPERFNPRGKTPTNIWSIPIRTQGVWRKPSNMDHLCPFPTRLVSRILELSTDAGDAVMDPFAGSGVVLAQAAAMGRKYVGFEINRTYVRMFEKSIKSEVAAEWAQIQRNREIHKNMNGDFEKTILKLRALKFARQVSKPFDELGARSKKDIRAILCLADVPRKYERKQPFRVKVYIVVDEYRTGFGAALRKVEERRKRQPLSLYEIDSSVKVITVDSLRRKTLLLEQRLYLYPRNKPRKHAGSRNLWNWLTHDHSGLADSKQIPLLSNVAVDVAWALQN
jgi:DNA modification methylase